MAKKPSEIESEIVEKEPVEAPVDDVVEPQDVAAAEPEPSESGDAPDPAWPDVVEAAPAVVPTPLEIVPEDVVLHSLGMFRTTTDLKHDGKLFPKGNRCEGEFFGKSLAGLLASGTLVKAPV